MKEARRLVVDDPIPFEAAVERIRAVTPVLPEEEIDLADAEGRVLSGDVAAPHPVPPFENSTVDGFAVRAADVRGASAERPVELEIRGGVMAGDGSAVPVAAGAAVRIMTGAPLPEGADSVVMLEWTSFTDKRVRVERETAAGRFIRRVGEDVAQGETVLRTGARLGPAGIGVLASLGCARVRVHRRPVVAVLATGDELLDVSEELTPGKIRSSNSWTLAGQAREAGAVVIGLGIARDDRADLARRIGEGRGADVLLTSGGVSVGDRDHVQPVLLEMGFRRVFWRVASSPGKPLLFGSLGDTLVFGIPGNPVSSMVVFENFVRPALRRMEGDASPGRARARAVLADPVSGPEERRHFARVRVSWTGDGLRAAEVRPHGSGNLRSMVHANALAVLPEGVGRLEGGDPVEVILLGEPDAPA